MQTCLAALLVPVSIVPGRSEIDDLCHRLAKAEAALDYREVRNAEVRGMDILPLYGALESELQRHIFDAARPGIRKIIVATVRCPAWSSGREWRIETVADHAPVAR